MDYGRPMFSYYVDDMVSSPWSHEKRYLEKLTESCATSEPRSTSNEVDPAINRTPWTDEENKKLLDLAAEYEEHDWVSIAAEDPADPDAVSSALPAVS